MKMLAEWFWIDRWDGSPAAALPIHARGLYREMLTRAWRLGGWLPNDHATIQRLVRVTPKEWRAAWPLIACYWQEQGDRLVNTTQLEVMAEARERKERARQKGSKGGSKTQAEREAKRLAEGVAKPELKGVAGIKPPSPSPSPVRTTDQSNDHVRARSNPFVEGKRADYEREALRLTGEIATLTGEDGAEVFARAAHYEGALRQKVNPAGLSDDRLLNTVLDLRATLKAEQAKRGPKAVTA